MWLFKQEKFGTHEIPLVGQTGFLSLGMTISAREGKL